MPIEKKSFRIDDIDVALLELLQENAKYTIKELSEKLNLSPTPIFERIKKLEQQGVIRKYVALLDLEKINKQIITYCNVSLTEHNPETLKKFEEDVKAFPEVIECYYIAGQYDYLLKVITSSLQQYQRFIIDRLTNATKVSQIHSQFVMGNVKYSTRIDLETLDR